MSEEGQRGGGGGERGGLERGGGGGGENVIEKLKNAKLIIQVGKPRTATTLQTTFVHLLLSIVAKKTPQMIDDRYVKSDLREEIEKSLLSRKGKEDGIVTIIKTHSFDKSDWEFVNDHIPVSDYVVFATVAKLNLSNRTFQNQFSKVSDRVIFVQNYALVKRNPHDIVLKYTEVFNLSKEEIDIVVEFIRYWQILRRCCGSQASSDWIQLLNKIGKEGNYSSMQRKGIKGFARLPLISSLGFEDKMAADESNCYIYNLEQVEKRMSETVVCQKSMVPTQLCKPLPSCAVSIDAFLSGKGFMYMEKEAGLK